jgi:hypothetical protein
VRFLKINQVFGRSRLRNVFFPCIILITCCPAIVSHLSAPLAAIAAMASPNARLSSIASSLSDLSAFDVSQTILVIIVVYNITVIIHRLYFSPLAKFPGPKVTAITQWYEIIIDLWNQNFPQYVKKMHEEHGRIQTKNLQNKRISMVLIFLKVLSCEYLPRNSIFTIPTFSMRCSSHRQNGGLP